jgi:hypothetical protein
MRGWLVAFLVFLIDFDFHGTQFRITSVRVNVPTDDGGFVIRL